MTLLLLIGCSKVDDHIDTVIKEKPTENSTMIPIIVQEDYDLKESVAYTIIDSTLMEFSQPSIYIPNDHESIVFFLDENLEEVLAIVGTDSSSSEIIVNAENVAIAVLDILPAMQVFKGNRKKDLLHSFKNDNLYSSLHSKIDSYLKTGESVYSTDEDYINLLNKINDWVTAQVMLELRTVEDSNKPLKRVNNSDRSDIKSYLIKDEDLLRNVEHSYIHVSLTSGSTGEEEYSFLMNPNPFILAHTELPLANFNDDCYEIKITQESDKAFEKNRDAFFLSLLNFIISELTGGSMDKLPTECVTRMMGAVSEELVRTGILNNLQLEEMPYQTPSTFNELSIGDIVSAAGAGLITAYKEPSCLKKAVSFRSVSIFILRKANLFSHLVDAGLKIAGAIEIAAYAQALLPGMRIAEVSATMQIYQGRLITGCVELNSIPESVKSTYSTGVEINPKIKMKIISSYDTIDLEGFPISWTALENNGIVNPLTSVTNSEGEATTTWKLPEVNGEYQLEAKLVDREGDHLKGSPGVFTTIVDPKYSQRLFSVVYEMSVVKLVELDIDNFSRIGTIATFDYMLNGSTCNEETSHIYFKRDNSAEIIEVNVNTGAVTTRDNGNNYGIPLILNGRFFTGVYEDGVVKLIELDKNNFSRIKTVATFDYYFGGSAFREETNEIYAKRSNSSEFIKININTGAVATYNVPGNYDAPLLFNNRLFSQVYEDGVVKLVELSMSDFSRIGTVATFHYMLSGGAFNEDTNEIYFKRQNSYEFVKININTGELTSYNIPGDFGVPLIYKVLLQSEN